MTADPAADDDRPARLVETWRRAVPAMADLPVFNPALGVHATAFLRWKAARIGVVVTPWFMNVVAVPDDPATLPPAGSPAVLPLPDGELDAIAAEADGVGRFAVASLFSPMDDFADAASAEAVAAAALDELFAVPEPDPRANLTVALDRRALFFGRRAEASP